MTEVRFTQTNFQTEVIVYAEQIVAITYGPVQKSTLLIGPGSTAIPVTDTPEEANRKIKAAMSAAKAKENKDGI